MEVRKFKKKPVIIEAIHFIDNKPETIARIGKFMGGCCTSDSMEGFFIQIDTLEGTMKAGIGDWIIKGVNGEFYPCKDEIFQKTYEFVGKEYNEINFLEKTFDIESLPIENNSFSGKIKAFLKRYQEDRYMDTVYIYNETSPEKETEQVKYDLFGINYMCIDKITEEEKVVYNTIPVPILQELFKIKACDLHNFSNESMSKEEYKRQISKY